MTKFLYFTEPEAKDQPNTYDQIPLENTSLQAMYQRLADNCVVTTHKEIKFEMFNIQRQDGNHRSN